MSKLTKNSEYSPLPILLEICNYKQVTILIRSNEIGIFIILLIYLNIVTNNNFL